MRWTKISIGKGFVDRLILVEWRHLFSVYYNLWHTVEQDRFHTHAFASIVIMLRGEYDEETILEDCTERVTHRAPSIRFLPRTNNHRILESRNNATSLTLAGPWDRIWYETFLDGRKRFLTWGRDVLN